MDRRRVLHSELGEDKFRPSPLLIKYVDAGWLGTVLPHTRALRLLWRVSCCSADIHVSRVPTGVKSGKGFYDYAKKQK